MGSRSESVRRQPRPRRLAALGIGIAALTGCSSAERTEYLAHLDHVVRPMEVSSGEDARWSGEAVEQRLAAAPGDPFVSRD